MPYDRDALRVLVEKVRAATGELPDDVLGRLLCALEGKAFGWADRGCGDDGSEELRVAGSDDRWFFSEYRHRCPDVSVDAALALMEQVLPGWEVHFYRNDEGPARYAAEMVWPPGALVGDAGYFGCDGHAATRPLAILAGVIEGKLALLAQAEAEADAGGQHVAQ